MQLKKRIAVVVLGALLGFVHLTGEAGASRADGVCGGIGTMYDPALGQCV